ncbi:MAG: class I SAM-dependent methyltransferase [Candidatus Paceibacterota bacterium]|jgi:SAM-dependent methyltransferase
MDSKQQTIDTYNKSAQTLTNKFNDLGGYSEDIKNTFSLVGIENPNTLEIGCGNGRDAEEILKYTKNYLGIDISKELIKIARERNTGAVFEVADIENYTFQNNLDVIFAFASLIHVPIESLRKIMDLAYNKLNNSGVFFATMKYNDNYIESTKEDEFGIRTYYLYSEDDIKKIVRRFKILKCDKYELRGQKWIKVLLQKI